MTTTLQPTTNQTTTSPSTPRRWSSLLRRHHRVLISVASVLVVLLVWEAAVRLLNVDSYLLPAPTEIASRLQAGLQPGSASYWSDLQSTLTATFFGFIIAVAIATTLGMAMAQWGLLERTASPYVFGLNALPKIALAPLLVLWAGFGLQAMVLVAVTVAFFPMLINALAGFKSVANEQSTMFRGLCASRTQTFFKLKLPAASPMLLAGIDLALIYAFLGTIAGEFLGGQEGLGVRIQTYASNVDVAGEFAVLAILAVVALIMHGTLVAVSRRVLFWTPSEIARRTD